jgi:hypothetical protein
MKHRSEFIDAAKQCICHDRQDQHGNPENTFDLIASYWTTYLSHECDQEIHVCGADVAVMMSLLKVARFQMNPNNDDNFVDGIGYLALAGELVNNLRGSEELLNDR